MKETERMDVRAEEVVEAPAVDKIVELEKEIAYMKGQLSGYDSKFQKIESDIAEAKKDTHTLSTMCGTLGLSVLIVAMAMAFCVWTQNNKLGEYAEAINNNSYSIESIITSIKGGPASNE